MTIIIKNHNKRTAMKEHYEIKLIIIGVIFSVIGAIIKMVEVGQTWPYIIMWLGWFMLSLGMLSLLYKKLKRSDSKQ